jgi:hypothetical protein
MFLMGWPMMLLIVLLAYSVAVLFPVLAGLLIVGAPLAVLLAFAVAAVKARNIRLVVTPEVVLTSSAKDAVSCDRDHVALVVLVESFRRRALAPRSTDLILVGRGGRAELLLSGLLWPAAILEEVVDALAPLPVERVSGRQTVASLAARYPDILRSPDGVRNIPVRRLGVMVGIGVLVGVLLVLGFGVFR